MSKAQQRSNWGKRPLTKSQVEYAALDAFIIPAIFDTIAFQSASAATPLDRRITSILQDFEAKDLEKSIAKHKSSHVSAPLFDMAKVKTETPASPVSPPLDFKNMSIDVDLVVRRWFGKPLPAIGKDAVIQMLLSTAATKERDASLINGKLIYFNRHDRFTEFQNAVALFVNIDYSADESTSSKNLMNHKHPGHYHYLDGNSFIYCRDVSPPVPGGKRYETKMPDYLLEWMIQGRWFDEASYQTNFISEEEGRPTSAAAPKSILLFCRMPGQPFVFCGRIGQPEVIQTYVNNMYFPSISFKLMDYEHAKLRERPRLSELWYSAPQERYTVDN